MKQLETIIGLEIHAQISTNTKMFCGCSNDSFGKEPNTNVCPICMGFPGMLPVPSDAALEKGIKAALALKCSIPDFSKFDRKNYFYPDLPLGYQISQYDEPVSVHGTVEFEVNGAPKKVKICRLHLENDAGKLTHTASGTLLDFNRAGSPLMEIVSDPDMRSAQEARAYAETVQAILRYCGSSEADMEKGMLRFDASVSMRPVGEEKLYPRAEIKNLNSFRSLESAIAYEVQRQTEMWENGSPLDREQTVGWDDDRGTTEVMREKESAADYRYFPEPDIPPLHVDASQVETWKKAVPELPHEKLNRFMTDFDLSKADAEFYIENQNLANLFEEVATKSKQAKVANSFIATVLASKLREKGLSWEQSPLEVDHLVELIQLVESGLISNNVAKSTLMEAMLDTSKMPKMLVDELGLGQVSDEGAIEAICQKVLEANPKAVEDIKSGQLKAMGSLVGGVMKESQGKANPGMVNEILSRLLGL